MPDFWNYKALTSSPDLRRSCYSLSVHVCVSRIWIPHTALYIYNTIKVNCLWAVYTYDHAGFAAEKNKKQTTFEWIYPRMKVERGKRQDPRHNFAAKFVNCHADGCGLLTVYLRTLYSLAQVSTDTRPVPPFFFPRLLHISMFTVIVPSVHVHTMYLHHL